jgi:hypothetical protein
MPFTFLIPYVGRHSAFVIGKGGSTIKKLMEETGCFINAEKPNAAEGRPLPFFHIEGPNEKMVNQATIKIQTMLMTSMMRNEKTLTSQNDDMGQQLQHLELKASHQADEEDVAALITANEVKADWIDMLTRKLAEKDKELASLLDVSNEVILLCASVSTCVKDTIEAKYTIEAEIREEESDDDSNKETGISDEKDVWIDKLTRKLTEKDKQLTTLTSLIDISKDTISSLTFLLGSSHVKQEEESDDDSDEEEEADEHISVDMGPLVNKVKGKDPCAKSVCTGSPICCNCCENRCCRCSRSKEWAKFPSGHMIPPK